MVKSAIVPFNLLMLYALSEKAMKNWKKELKQCTEKLLNST